MVLLLILTLSTISSFTQSKVYTYFDDIERFLFIPDTMVNCAFIDTLDEEVIFIKNLTIDNNKYEYKRISVNKGLNVYGYYFKREEISCDTITFLDENTFELVEQKRHFYYLKRDSIWNYYVDSVLVKSVVWDIGDSITSMFPPDGASFNK